MNFLSKVSLLLSPNYHTSHWTHPAGWDLYIISHNKCYIYFEWLSTCHQGRIPTEACTLLRLIILLCVRSRRCRSITRGVGDLHPLPCVVSPHPGAHQPADLSTTDPIWEIRSSRSLPAPLALVMSWPAPGGGRTTEPVFRQCRQPSRARPFADTHRQVSYQKQVRNIATKRKTLYHSEPLSLPLSYILGRHALFSVIDGR